MSSRPRYFVSGQPLVEGEEFFLEPVDSHHAAKVLRLQTGDQVEVSDGRGRCFMAEITSSSASAVQVLLNEPLIEITESSTPVVLLQGLLKGGKMDTVVQQAVELGASRIIPLITERSVPVFKKTKIDHKIERWQKIARAAASQCRRTVLPRVDMPMEMARLEESIDSSRELSVSFWEEKKDKAVDLNDCIGNMDKYRAIKVIVGPEGGFTPQEMNLLERLDVQVAGLGPRILRAETAAVVALTMMQCYLGDLHGVDVKL